MARLFTDGINKYGNSGDYIWVAAATPLYGPLLSQWTAVDLIGTSSTIQIVDGAFSGSRALSINGASGVSNVKLRKVLSSNYATTYAGFRFKTNSNSDPRILLFQLLDGTTPQLSYVLNASGKIEVRSGDYNGTVIATSTEVLSINTWYHLAFGTTINNTTGAYTVKINDVVSSLNATNVNTRGGTANNYMNAFAMGFGANTGTAVVLLQDIYVNDNSGGAPWNTYLGDARIETQTITGDNSVQFSVGPNYIGNPVWEIANASGWFLNGSANQLYLRPFVSPCGGPLQSINAYAKTTAAGARFRAVVYADNGSGSAPTGAPIATGSEVTGATANTTLSLPFSSPPTLVAGTIYWIGFYTDTSVSYWGTDNLNSGMMASFTYAATGPTSPSMTGGQVSIAVWGIISAPTSGNYKQQAVRPAGIAYNYDNVVGHKDLYTVSPITGNPTTIYGVVVYGLVGKSDAGGRTVNFISKSVSTESNGDNTGQSVPGTMSFMSTFVQNDPNTSAAWGVSAVNAQKIGVTIAS